MGQNLFTRRPEFVLTVCWWAPLLTKTNHSVWYSFTFHLLCRQTMAARCYWRWTHAFALSYSIFATHFCHLCHARASLPFITSTELFSIALIKVNIDWSFRWSGCCFLTASFRQSINVTNQMAWIIICGKCHQMCYPFRWIRYHLDQSNSVNLFRHFSLF